MKKPLILTILDGCGIRENPDGNAFKNANKPTFDYLWENYPHSLLEASGTYVGLPYMQMGNSEVGHTNIGAGRVVYQNLELINRSIKDKSFFENPQILNVINHVKENNSKLHIMGLLSDGGVHSHINHLFALVELAKKNNIKVCYHLFLDGRDVGPKTAYKYIKMVEDLNYGEISTISGRYYAMDRDNNFDRLKLFYDALVYADAKKYNSAKEMIDESYKNNITDEFVIPSIIHENKLEDNDGVITFNFRKDRLRELFTCLTNPHEYNEMALEKDMHIKEFKNIKCLTMMKVVETVKCPHAFDEINLTNILGEVLEKNNLNQLRIAETEKYAHVTFFFNGGVEEPNTGEERILVNSPKVATYDLKPEMSAKEVTDTLIDELNKDIYDVVILNYANGDMVGHTGNYDAAKKAVEFLDKCLERLYKLVLEKDGILVITADHGNCDTMWDHNHNVVTSHTLERVPFIVTKKGITLEDGSLCDIAPTILKLLNIEIPEEMTGKVLFK